MENIEKIRRVYLPAGNGWTDFWTGEKYKGGQWIVSEAAIDKIPLLVRQGSIIPMGPVMQYNRKKWMPNGRYGLPRGGLFIYGI